MRFITATPYILLHVDCSPLAPPPYDTTSIQIRNYELHAPSARIELFLRLPSHEYEMKECDWQCLAVISVAGEPEFGSHDYYDFKTKGRRKKNRKEAQTADSQTLSLSLSLISKIEKNGRERGTNK